MEPLVDTKHRKNMFIFFFGGAALLSLLVWVYITVFLSGIVSTDNAYTAADIAEVAAPIDGLVESVVVEETAIINKGDVLVNINAADANIALREAEANVRSAEAKVTRTKSDYERRHFLSKTGSTSKEDLIMAESSFNVAKADLDLAKAKLAEAQLTLDRTIIKAPISGVIAKRSVQLGQKVTSGKYLLSIVPLDHVYVNANFKENQMEHIKVGQRADVYADMYGKSVLYQGKVVGIAGGTGSVFSIIPAQNATGNWIKVLQRLPVRISLNKEELQKKPLQVGLSMDVKVHTSSREK